MMIKKKNRKLKKKAKKEKIQKNVNYLILIYRCHFEHGQETLQPKW
jgi:hypothetical protein